MTSTLLNLGAMRKSWTVYSPAAHRMRGDGKMRFRPSPIGPSINFRTSVVQLTILEK
jgi:hypothetical protein